jgi:hypothetical protein
MAVAVAAVVVGVACEPPRSTKSTYSSICWRLVASEVADGVTARVADGMIAGVADCVAAGVADGVTAGVADGVAIIDSAVKLIERGVFRACSLISINLYE